MEIDDEATAPSGYLFFERQSMHNGSFNFANASHHQVTLACKKKKRDERDSDSEGILISTW